MKKSLAYKIVGIVIVVLWIFVIAELTRRTHFASKRAEFSREDEKGITEGDSEQWMDILLKGRKAGYAVTKVTRVN